jgi:hypothetical protein
MPDVDAFVWHDFDGNITAVGHVVAGSAKKIEPLARNNQKVFKVRMDKENLNTLHLTHAVDVERGALYPRDNRNAGHAPRT